LPLNPGTRLGSYEISGSLGAGGMGEVYRARDTRLGRDVAIKVLPDLFAADPERVARFEREAQAVAALSHPNILAIHDYGIEGTRAYAVMELLDGETLRDQLADGALPPRKAIEYGVQIARGLAAAHDKGIVHRDLKPENIVVTSDGLVKILDFGLARQAPLEVVGASVATYQQDTAPGSVLGTVGYMSPEQVRGEPVDARSDLFAFGSVLFEMLTGRRAFQRDTAAETMTAILREDPPELAPSRGDLPPALDRIVRHCLEKNRQQRFQTARDVAFALEALSGSSTGIMALPPPQKPRWTRIVAALALIGAVLLAGLALGRRMSAPTVELPSFEPKTFEPQAIFGARFAPDGRTIVFSAALQGNEPELFVSREGATVPQPLGLRRAHLLSISSKGELAVLTNATFLTHRLFDGTLSRMPIDGAPRPWIEHVREADWSPDGSTLAIIRVEGVKDQLEYPIGSKLYETTGYLSDVRVSPDGSRVAFMDHQNRYDNRGWVKVVDREGNVRTLGGEYWGEEGVSWSSDGRHVLFSASDLDGGAYQPHIASAIGDPNARVAFRTVGSALLLDVRDDRWILLSEDERFVVRTMFAGASEEREIGWLGSSLNPILSRDGKTLVFGDESQSAGANYAIMMVQADGGGIVRLGEGMAFDLSPDGSRVLAGMYTPPAIRLYPTGSGEPRTLNTGSLKTPTGAWFFPDGKRILACGEERSGGRRCYTLDAAGSGPAAAMPEGITARLISPDGERAIVRALDDSFEMFTFRDGRLNPLPLRRDERPVQWSSDGRSVFACNPSVIPSRLERIDLASGNRTLVRELAPPERAGVIQLVGVSVVGDGRAYAYGYWKRFSKLFLATHAPH
jgi:eukaryotic-like serine/threonine-protein kinase